jgi:hypothetical protein
METEQDVLGLMARHEAAIGELYETLAVVFPEREDLWLTLAAEEKEHSQAVLALRQQSGSAMARPYLRFKPQPILSSIAFAEERRAKALSGQMTLIEALALTRELESAVLESHAIRTASEAPPSLKPTLVRLGTDTHRHRALAEAALAEERGRTGG